MYAVILRNDVGWFDEEENNSSLVAARLNTEAAAVKSAIAERISVILQNMTSLLVSFIVGFIIEWRVAILILVTFPLLVLANFAQVKNPIDIYYLLSEITDGVLVQIRTKTMSVISDEGNTTKEACVPCNYCT